MLHNSDLSKPKIHLIAVRIGRLDVGDCVRLHMRVKRLLKPRIKLISHFKESLRLSNSHSSITENKGAQPIEITVPIETPANETEE